MDDTTPTMPPLLKDRKTGLVIFGVLQIAFGALCALIALLVAGTTLMLRSVTVDTEAVGADPAAMLTAVLVYVLVAAWFLTMGIGSILARRWARALTLVASWLWLAAGVSGIMFALFFMGDMYESIAADGQLPPGFAQMMNMIVLGFMAAFYVAIPGSLLLFYRMPSVKATCERHNPQPSWTDASPLPVLAHTCLLIAYSVSMLFVTTYNWTIPFFGQLLSGAIGATVAIPSAALFLGLAWGIFRLKPAVWWATLACTIVWSTSALLTFSRVSMIDFYSEFGMPEQQLDAMRHMLQDGDFERMIVVSIAFWSSGLIGLMLYTKRFYLTGDNAVDNAE